MCSVTLSESVCVRITRLCCLTPAAETRQLLLQVCAQPLTDHHRILYLLQLMDVVFRLGPGTDPVVLALGPDPTDRQVQPLLLRAICGFLHNVAAALASSGPQRLRQVLPG
jgi:hypothetical protein